MLNVMEVLALAFIWPFLVLALGLTFITFTDWGGFGHFGWFGGWFFWPFLIILGFFILPSIFSRARKAGEHKSAAGQLATVRRGVIAISIALLLPTFVRYLVDSLNSSLIAVILALMVGFGFIVWGIFMKNRHSLMYGNIVGGSLAIFYAYSHIWNLGELPRIEAAAVGLVIAVIVAVLKLKDKLS